MSCYNNQYVSKLTLFFVSSSNNWFILFKDVLFCHKHTINFIKNQALNFPCFESLVCHNYNIYNTSQLRTTIHDVVVNCYN